MPRVVISRADDHDVVEAELTGEAIELTSLPLQGGHMVFLGSPDFVACYAARLKAVDQLTDLRELYRRMLEENKSLNEALSRVQGRCTELLMQNRAVLRNPGERLVKNCGECPCAYYSSVDGDMLMCGLSEDSELDCIPIGDAPKDCPLKHKPLTLRVADG